jgi:conjugal transfer pilus assembly protein TraA
MPSKPPYIDKNPGISAPLVLAVVIAVALSTGAAHAGTGGSEFDTVWTQLSDWSQGTLGRIISILMIMTGIAGGVVRQSLAPTVTGAGAGVVLYNAPKVIESILAAAVSGEAALPQPEAVIKLLQAVSGA